MSHAMCNMGSMSQTSYPMILGVSIWNIHSCGMHALMAFEKDMANTIHRYILCKQTDIPEIASMVDQWMNKQNISLKFEYVSS